MMKSEIPEDKDQARGLRRPSIEESALILFQMMKQSPPSPSHSENAKPSRWDDHNTKPSSSSSAVEQQQGNNNQKFQTSPPITSTPTASNSNSNNSSNKNNSPHPLPLTTSSPTSPSPSHFEEEEAPEQHHGFNNNNNNHYNYNIGSNNNNNNEQTASPSPSPSSCHLPSCLLCSRGQPLLLIKSPTWASIMRVVFFCLKHDFPNKHFFSLKTDVYSFMLCHWEKLCLNKKRSDNWHKQIQDMLSHSKNLFESGMDKYKQNGYWRLKQMIDPWTIQKDRSSKKLPGPGQHLSPKRGLELMENGSPNPTPPSSSNSPQDEEQEEEQIEFETLRIPTSHNSPLTKKLRLNSPSASPELTIDDETEYIVKSNANNEHHNPPRTRTPTPTRNLSSPPNPVMANYYPLSKSATALPTINNSNNNNSNNNNNSHTPLSSPSPQTIHHQPPLQPQQQQQQQQQQYVYSNSQQPQPQLQSQPQQSQTGFVGEVQSLRSQLSSMTESLLAIRAQLRKKPSFPSPTPPSLTHSGIPYAQSYNHNHNHSHSHVHSHTHTPPHPTHAAVYPTMPLAPSHYASMSPYGYRLYTDENMWCYDERLRKGMSGFPSTSFELPPIASLPHARPPPAYSSPHYVFSPPSSSACTTPNISSSSPDIHMNKIHPFYSHSIISPHMPIHAHHPTRLYSTPPPRTISMVANH